MASQTTEKTRWPGVYKVHRRGCTRRGEGRCGCPPSYQASVYSAGEKKSIRKHFGSLGAAKTWREDASAAVRTGRMKTPSRMTVAAAADALVAGMEDQTIINRSGRPYKPSAVRSYRLALDKRVKPALGHRRLHQLERAEIQGLVDRLRAKDGLSPSTIANTVDPLRVICRRALRDGELAIDPTVGLEMPAVRGARDRIASPEQAQALLDALPDVDRPLWTVAFFAGLRRGELRALRWDDVDLAEGVIGVSRSLDDMVGEIEVKSDAGERDVPLIGRVRRELVAHRLATGRSGSDLVFGRTARLPFTPSAVRHRARAAWRAANAATVERAEEEGREVEPGELLDPITLHEARHCAASYLIAAGLNPKEISVYIGHSDIRTTYNRYGHLLPGGHARAATRLDDFFGDGAAEGG
jgi:integrase